MDGNKEINAYSKLYSLIRTGTIDEFRLVLEKKIEAGLKINNMHEDGWGILEFAIRLGKIEIVKLLIAKGANINYKGCVEQTPLMRAVQCGNFEAAELLIKHKVNVNAKTKRDENYLTIGSDYEEDDGFTALIDAVLNENFEMAKLLVKNKADVNAETRLGYTVLMYAVNSGNFEMVELLVKNGARVDIIDKYGTTVLSNAKDKGNTKIIDLIEATIREIKE